MRTIIDSTIFKNLKIPSKGSHKGNNGKVMIIGGSKLFHGASLFALKTASRIVDMVYFCSVEENLELTHSLKSQLYSFISVPREKLHDYIQEADVILIGPGMVRGDTDYTGTGEDGEQTRALTLDLFAKYPDKQWVIDAGALQAVTVSDLKKLKNPIITPHLEEFRRLLGIDIPHETTQIPVSPDLIDLVKKTASEIGGVVVLKGKIDIIADSTQVLLNQTGNQGMTKGGTGDVLAGLIAALVCSNDPFLAASVGVYVNGLAGDKLYEKVGPFFNADDLADIVPEVLWLRLK